MSKKNKDRKSANKKEKLEELEELEDLAASGNVDAKRKLAKAIKKLK